MNNSEVKDMDTLNDSRADLITCIENQLDLLDKLGATDLVTDLKKLPDNEIKRNKTILTSENLPRNKEILAEEIKKLENFDVVVSVVGTMKAGKSTTINAIVGRELMPNRNRPMTALPTLIVHNPEQLEAVLKFDNPEIENFIKHLNVLFRRNPGWKNIANIKENHELKALMEKIEQGETFKKEYSGEKEIFDFLADLNDLVRLVEILRQNNVEKEAFSFPYASCRNIEQLPRIEVAFSYLSELEQMEGRLILLDTPGPNEAGQNHLKLMLEEQLQRSSVVLLILDYTQLKSDADHGVREQIDRIPHLDKNRLFALVNKFDQENANSDNADTTKKIIYEDLLKEKIAWDHIYPVSAQRAYLANRMMDEIRITGKKPDFCQDSWVKDFAGSAFGAMAEKIWGIYTLEQLQEVCKDLSEISKIEDVVKNAIVQTQREAPKIAICSALKKSDEIQNSINQVSDIAFTVINKVTEEEIKQLKENIEQMDKKIAKLKEIKETVKNEVVKIIEENEKNLEEDIKQVEQKTNDNMKDLFAGTREKIREIKRKKQEEIKEIEIRIKEIEEINILHRDVKDIVWRKEWLNKRKSNLEKELDYYEVFQHNNEGVIIFNSDHSKRNFSSSLDELGKNNIESFLENVKSLLEGAKGNVENEFKKIENECRNIFESIDQRLKEGGFKLNIVFPEMASFEEFKNQEFICDVGFEKKEKVYRREQDSWWGWIKRSVDFFDSDWGYDECKETFYTINISDIEEKVLNHMQTEVFVKVQCEVRDHFAAFDEGFIENYVEQVKDTLEPLVNQLAAEINKYEDETKDKQRRKDIIKRLKDRADSITEDICSIADEFKVDLKIKVS